ncbi:hypothetical protein QBC41DRAFT_372354 [Cercophora samala]|uniref:Uncharacterized protein n=1 Tax=Cercophora samala TaxID=330535 RepID=A0AA39ZGS3_9PEZI|nr:hypothetical protein QBC41DRAFT_372354 [Cercophora samala]
MTGNNLINLKTLTRQQERFLDGLRDTRYAPGYVAKQFNQLLNPPLPISDHQVTAWRRKAQGEAYRTARPRPTPSQSHGHPPQSQVPVQRSQQRQTSDDPEQTFGNQGVLHPSTADPIPQYSVQQPQSGQLIHHPARHQSSAGLARQLSRSQSYLLPLPPSQFQQNIGNPGQHQSPAGIVPNNQNQVMLAPLGNPIYQQQQGMEMPGGAYGGYDAGGQNIVHFNTPISSASTSPLSPPVRSPDVLDLSMAPVYSMPQYPLANLPGVFSTTGVAPTLTQPGGLTRGYGDEIPLEYPRSRYSGHQQPMLNHLAPAPPAQHLARARMPTAPGMRANDPAGSLANQLGLASQESLRGRGNSALLDASTTTPLAPASGHMPPQPARSQARRPQADGSPDWNKRIKVSLPYDDSRLRNLIPLRYWNTFLRSISSSSLEQLSRTTKNYLQRNLISDLAAFGQVPTRNPTGRLKVFVFAPGCTPDEAQGVDRHGVWFIGTHDRCERNFVHRHDWDGNWASHDAVAVNQWNTRPPNAAETCTQNLIQGFRDQMRATQLQYCPMISRSPHSSPNRDTRRRASRQEQGADSNSGSGRAQGSRQQDSQGQPVSTPTQPDLQQSQPPPTSPLAAQPATQQTRRSSIFFGPDRIPRNRDRFPAGNSRLGRDQGPPNDRAREWDDGTPLDNQGAGEPPQASGYPMQERAPPPLGEPPSPQGLALPQSQQANQLGQQEASPQAHEQGDALGNHDFPMPDLAQQDEFWANLDISLGWAEQDDASAYLAQQDVPSAELAQEGDAGAQSAQQADLDWEFLATGINPASPTGWLQSTEPDDLQGFQPEIYLAREAW